MITTLRKWLNLLLKFGIKQRNQVRCINSKRLAALIQNKTFFQIYTSETDFSYLRCYSQPFNYSDRKTLRVLHAICSPFLYGTENETKTTKLIFLSNFLCSMLSLSLFCVTFVRFHSSHSRSLTDYLLYCATAKLLRKNPYVCNIYMNSKIDISIMDSMRSFHKFKFSCSFSACIKCALCRTFPCPPSICHSLSLSLCSGCFCS